MHSRAEAQKTFAGSIDLDLKGGKSEYTHKQYGSLFFIIIVCCVCLVVCYCCRCVCECLCCSSTGQQHQHQSVVIRGINQQESVCLPACVTAIHLNEHQHLITPSLPPISVVFSVFSVWAPTRVNCADWCLQVDHHYRCTGAPPFYLQANETATTAMAIHWPIAHLLLNERVANGHQYLIW